MKLRLFTISMTIALFCSMGLSSCMMTQTSVGTFKESPGSEYTYDKGKQMWLFWGLMPLGRTDLSTPPSGSCQLETKFRFTDLLISGLTAGILTSYSLKVKAKKEK